MPDLTPVRCPKCRRLVHPMQLYPNDAGCGCTPRRIQRQRKAGQPGMPSGAVYVGRPSKWGNPFRVSRDTTAAVAVELFQDMLNRAPTADTGTGWGCPGETVFDTIRRELAGKDLACWCPLDQPCHADVLLEIANGDPL